MVYVFLANGFEEIEALTVVDLMRRAVIDINTVSVNGDSVVKGSHGISVKTDIVYDQADFDVCEMMVLPGGMPGTTNLCAHKALNEKLVEFHDTGKKVAAICAAPMVFGKAGLLHGHEATIYSGMEAELTGAVVKDEKVVVSGNVITSKGPGTAMDFALTLIEILKGKEAADKVAKGLLYK